jgi:hypothetical protein
LWGCWDLPPVLAGYILKRFGASGTENAYIAKRFGASGVEKCVYARVLRRLQHPKCMYSRVCWRLQRPKCIYCWAFQHLHVRKCTYGGPHYFKKMRGCAGQEYPHLFKSSLSAKACFSKLRGAISQPMFSYSVLWCTPIAQSFLAAKWDITPLRRASHKGPI